MGGFIRHLLFALALAAAPCTADATYGEAARYPTGLGAQAIGMGCVEVTLQGAASVHGNPSGLASVVGVCVTGSTEFDGPGFGFFRRRLADRSSNFVENIGRRHLAEPYQCIALRLPKFSVALGTQQTLLVWARNDSIVRYPFTSREWGVRVEEYEMLLAENTIALAFGSASSSLGIAVFIPQAGGNFRSGIFYSPDDPLHMPNDLSHGKVWSDNSVGVRCGFQKEGLLASGFLRLGAFFERTEAMRFQQPSFFPVTFGPPVRIGAGLCTGPLSRSFSLSAEVVRISYSDMETGREDSIKMEDATQFKGGLEFNLAPYLPLRAGFVQQGPQQKGQPNWAVLTYGTSLSFNRVTGLPSNPFFKEFVVDFAGSAALTNTALTATEESPVEEVTHGTGTSYFASLTLVF